MKQQPPKYSAATMRSMCTGLPQPLQTTSGQRPDPGEGADKSSAIHLELPQLNFLPSISLSKITAFGKSALMPLSTLVQPPRCLIQSSSSFSGGMCITTMWRGRSCSLTAFFKPSERKYQYGTKA